MPAKVPHFAAPNAPLAGSRRAGTQRSSATLVEGPERSKVKGLVNAIGHGRETFENPMVPAVKFQETIVCSLGAFVPWGEIWLFHWL